MNAQQFYCHRTGRGWAHIFPSRKVVAMCGDYPIHHVNVEIVDAPNDDDYWAWYHLDKNEVSMIFKTREELVVCFPYGLEVAEKNPNRPGRAVRVRITEIAP